MLGGLQPFLEEPILLGVLTVLIMLALNYQRNLSWPEYKTIHSLKRGVLPLIDKYTGVFVVSRKGGREDGEYVATVDKSLRATFKQLANDGFSPHVINSIKQRPHPDDGQAQYSGAHLIKIHSDGTQTEIYLFNMGGKCDLYAHNETAVTDPKGHLVDTNQKDGDTKDVLPRWVDEKGVSKTD